MYSCYQKYILKIILLLFSVLNSYVSAQKIQQLSPISINHGWKFCPVQNFQPEVDQSVLDCKPIKLPGGWESVQPDYDGYGLLYTQFNMPAHYSKKPLGIFIHRLRDADKILINNHLVGEMGKFPPNFQKAVLYSRLYFIPNHLLKFDQPNEIKIWVYNDARPGGITNSVPIINEYTQLLENFYHDNYIVLAFIAVLITFALLHLIYYFFHQHARENLIYTIFLFCWSGYLFTYSNLALVSHFSMNTLFRSSIALFFAIFSLFPLFIYQFFNQQLPKTLKVIIAITVLLIPLCFLLPEPRLLYYPLQLVEIMTLPTLFLIYWLLIKSIRAKLAYAKLTTAVVILYTTLGSIDIAVDFFQSETLTNIHLYGSKALLIVSVVLTLIVSHKNFLYFKQATIDQLTGALRYNEFLLRLEQELFRANRENKLLVVIMLDLDNFKSINDQYGHIQGNNVLTIVASCIRRQLRHFDLLCRYGGDEFCIAASLDNEQEVHNFVERIHQSVNELVFDKNGLTEKISATFGAEIREPQQKASPQALIESADHLLVVAKAKMKGSVFWQQHFPRISSSYSPKVDH